MLGSSGSAGETDPGTGMRNLFDIMREAQGGSAFGSLSQQFGLDKAATQMAVEALLPAFSIALQRSMQNPAVFGGLLETMFSGPYGRFFEGQPGFGAAAMRPGQDVMGQLFGSPGASQDVARHASQMTGIGVRVLQEMMPVIAATLVGGMLRYATAEGFADLLRQWSEMLRTMADRTNPPPAPKVPTDPWSAWMGMMGMPGTASAPPRAPPPAAESWMRAMGGGAFLPPPAKVESPASPTGLPNPFEALARLFETGREVQAQYLASLEAIFPPVPPQRP